MSGRRLLGDTANVINPDGGVRHTFMAGTYPPEWAWDLIPDSAWHNDPDAAADSPAAVEDADGYPDGGHVGEVLEWAGDDPARRRYALAAERLRTRPRQSVLNGLV